MALRYTATLFSYSDDVDGKSDPISIENPGVLNMQILADSWDASTSVAF